MLESLFNKVAGLKTLHFIKKRLQHKYFPVNFRKFLKTTFFTEHLRWLLLKRVCEGTSLVKILQSYHLHIFGINRRWFKKMPIKKIMNNRDCWNVYRSSFYYSKLYVFICEIQKNLYLSREQEEGGRERRRKGRIGEALRKYCIKGVGWPKRLGKEYFKRGSS